MALAPGVRLGSYEIVSQIGQGGMGVVYRARDLTLERDVAIKVLDDDASSSRGVTGPDLLREARHASSLNHPNICAIHHAGEAGEQRFVVMELVSGQTLEARIPSGGLSLEQLLRYGTQLAAGTAHAHDRRIVHGDLKSGNVMIADNGQIKILDFGLARKLPALEEITRSYESLGETGTTGGTLPYMAPELLQGQPATPSSDVWAIGVILHEMCTGARPFRGPTAGAISAAILRDAAPALPERLPPSLGALIARCLAKDPSERYQTGSEVRAALEMVSPEPVTRTASAASGHGGALKVRGRLVWWPLVAGGALLLAAIATFLGGRDRGGSVEAHQLVSTFPGAHRSGSLSPDGTFIAFIQSDVQGIAQVWVKSLESGEPVQITQGDTDAFRPRWAAAGNHIVFARRGAGIWSVSPLGGPPRQIVEWGMNPDVAADGRTIVFEHLTELWVVEDGGGDPRQITGFPPRIYSLPYTPAISPDGRRVAFFRPELGPNGDFWVVPIDGGGEARRLTNDLCEGESPVWTPDGERIIFSSARTGSRTLWSISADGSDLTPVTSGAGDDLEPDISTAGDRLLYTNVRNAWRLHIWDLATGSRRVAMDRREPILWPRFSPDGDTLAFFGPSPSGPGHIFTISREGRDIRQLTDRRGDINTMPRWSADGTSILFYQMAPTKSLRQLPVVGGAVREIAPLNWDRSPGAMIDPRGSSLVYYSRDNGGATLVREMDTGTERRLDEAIRSPRWSPDGRQIAGDRDGAISICVAATGSCRRLTAGEHPVWTPDGSQLYVLRPGGSREFRELWSIDLATGDERQAGRLGPMRAIDVTFDISARGELVWTEFDRGEPELWLAALAR